MQKWLWNTFLKNSSFQRIYREKTKNLQTWLPDCTFILMFNIICLSCIKKYKAKKETKKETKQINNLQTDSLYRIFTSLVYMERTIPYIYMCMCTIVNYIILLYIYSTVQWSLNFISTAWSLYFYNGDQPI